MLSLQKLVEYQQARLQQGYGGDDTLLEKAIMFALRGHKHIIQVSACMLQWNAAFEHTFSGHRLSNAGMRLKTFTL